MAKADNLLAVLWLLRSRRRMTAPQIAEALEVSELREAVAALAQSLSEHHRAP